MINLNIHWIDHSFNTWIGCTKVSPACDNSYAEKIEKRCGGEHLIVPPRQMEDNNWDNPYKWNLKAIQSDERTKVFFDSMCNIFDYIKNFWKLL